MNPITMRNVTVFCFLFLIAGMSVFAQVGINSDNSLPNSAAMLDVKSNTKGFLPPRMTRAEVIAIVNPPDGLIVFCSDCGNNPNSSPGSIVMYQSGDWYSLNSMCMNTIAPVQGTHVASPTQIIWNWSAVPNATGYKWNTINDEAGAVILGVTTKTETGLNCLTSYNRYVWAMGHCGVSVSTVLTQSTLGDVVLSPIAGVHVPSLTQIVWKWNAVPGAIGYRWSVTDDFESAIDMGTSQLIMETGLICNTSYLRYVWAYSSCGNSVPTTLTQATLSSAISAPTSGTHTPSPTQIVWNWNTVSSAIGYKWSTTNIYSTAIDIGSAHTYTETGLTCLTPYTRYIWAYNTCGHSTSTILTQSTISETVTTPISGTHVPSTTQIIWNWNTVPEATGYKFNTDNNYATATDIGIATTKVDTGLTCNTSYTRYIWAYSGCGSSTSATLSQTTSVCTGFTCGQSITINHLAGTVAPVSKTTTYGTVTNIPGELTKCWITSNLGSDHQATAVNDATEASAGWYWQFNRKQGYKHDGTTRTPNTVWISIISENSDWQIANDPCHLEIGPQWRLPTYTEWYNVDLYGYWTNWNGPWGSDLKLHATGYLAPSSSQLLERGSKSYYSSSTQKDLSTQWIIHFYSSYSGMGNPYKSTGSSVRCLRDN